MYLEFRLVDIPRFLYDVDLHHPCQRGTLMAPVNKRCDSLRGTLSNRLD